MENKTKPEPSTARDAWRWAELAAAVLGLLVGGLLWATGNEPLAAWCWGGAALAVLVPASLLAARQLWQRRPGVDVIAVASMVVALALGEALSGAIVALMFSGGRILEDYAMQRTRREMSALLRRAPRLAHRLQDERLSDVAIEDVAVGDKLLVKPGEVTPTDGLLLSSQAVLDQSALTGESRAVTRLRADTVQSGVVNIGGPFELRATTTAEQSTFAAIARLVREAGCGKAPMSRLADRYAGGLLLLTTIFAALAYALSRDPVRVLAVLVVATPCPLILAVPVALMAGLARAARGGVLVKGGPQLEALANAQILLLDKTGTVTVSRPDVLAIESFGALSTDELLQLAASLDQLSSHPAARALLAEARRRGLKLDLPEHAEEEGGSGVRAAVKGRLVSVGQRSWIGDATQEHGQLRSLETRARIEGASTVYVGVDGRVEGVILLHDPIRVEAPRVLRALREAGLRSIHLLTGDHPDVAAPVGDVLGVDHVFAERGPSDKLDVVRKLRADGPVMMVGDGINDTPALALADVGVAMGARGTAAAAEAADVVLTVDRLDGLLVARRVATETLRIARQSMVFGMAASVLAMIAATLGWLPPVWGALLQEAIDVLAVANALRALGLREPHPPASWGVLGRALATDHQKLRAQLNDLSQLAARLDTLPPLTARGALEALRETLEQQVLPHERHEQLAAYPAIRELTYPSDPTGPLVQTHHEITRLARLFGRLVDQLPAAGPSPDDLRELRRSLYGLYAVLTLHCAQEDELYSMFDTAAPS